MDWMVMSGYWPNQKWTGIKWSESHLGAEWTEEEVEECFWPAEEFFEFLFRDELSEVSNEEGGARGIGSAHGRRWGVRSGASARYRRTR